MRIIAIMLLLTACVSEEAAKDKSYGKNFQQCVTDNQCVDLDVVDCAGDKGSCASSPLGVSGKCVMGRCQSGAN